MMAARRIAVLTAVAATIVTLTGAGCTYQEPVTVIADYYTSRTENRFRDCATGQHYDFVTSSYGATRFYELEAKLGATDHELLLGEFLGYYDCGSPWSCIRGESDLFIILRIVDIQRGTCPPRG